jgi:hypothetical protein
MLQRFAAALVHCEHQAAAYAQCVNAALPDVRHTSLTLTSTLRLHTLGKTM